MSVPGQSNSPESNILSRLLNGASKEVELTALSSRQLQGADEKVAAELPNSSSRQTSLPNKTENSGATDKETEIRDSENNSGIQIFARPIFTNDWVTLDTTLTTTISNLKINFYTKYDKVPPDRLRFLFKGDRLKDEKTLAECNLKHEDTIFVLSHP